MEYLQHIFHSSLESWADVPVPRRARASGTEVPLSTRRRCVCYNVVKPPAVSICKAWSKNRDGMSDVTRCTLFFFVQMENNTVSTHARPRTDAVRLGTARIDTSEPPCRDFCPGQRERLTTDISFTMAGHHVLPHDISAISARHWRFLPGRARKGNFVSVAS